MKRLLRLVLIGLAASAAAIVLARPAAQSEGDCKVPLITSGWTTDFCRHTVPFEEIIDVISRDAIPAIDNPVFESVEEAREWLVDQSPVIVVEINGDARAYAQAIMTWHEIVNDEIGDVPVAVTFCPLCNSSLVFDRRVDDQVLTFGVSGKLRNSDLIMFDRETQSWWQQFTGEGIVGEHSGKLLDIVPSIVVGFGEFARRYPDGQVLSLQTGYSRSYGVNPYSGYDNDASPFLFKHEIDPRLFAVERVLAGTIGGEPIAYPFAVLAEARVVNDTVGGMAVVAFWQPGAASALGDSRIDDARDIGMAALYNRELDGQVLTFVVDDNGMIIDDQTGSAWNVFGEAVEGELAGSRLQQEIAAPHFWFAWAAFRPETRIYGQDQ